MDPRFTHHNRHLESIRNFQSSDPHLSSLKKLKYVYHADLIDDLPTTIPGVYTVGGGRQIGKTTLLKQWMNTLLKRGTPPQSIVFFSGEPILDQHSLVQLITEQLKTMQPKKIKFLIIDEVTYIQNWARGIKFLIDGGLLDDTIVILSGSDAVQLRQEAVIYLAGRRGKSNQVDFHYYSLSFKEYLTLTKQLPSQQAREKNDLSSIIQPLYEALNQYLIHGGFLTAINEYAEKKSISNATLMTYSDWIRGDVLKRDKQENFLHEIISATIKRYNSQVSWNALAKDLSIDHPKTIGDYITLLEAMDAMYVQHAIIEDKLIGAPKKAKKIMFTDPFIYHAMNAWVHPTANPFEEQIAPIVQSPETSSKLIESTVTCHFRRHYPTFYIKSEGEIDVAYVQNNKFWPVEIKWTSQLRPKDLKQITKYNNAKIYAKVMDRGTIFDIPAVPLPLALIDI